MLKTLNKIILSSKFKSIILTFLTQKTTQIDQILLLIGCVIIVSKVPFYLFVYFCYDCVCVANRPAAAGLLEETVHSLLAPVNFCQDLKYPCFLKINLHTDLFYFLRAKYGII